MRSLSGAHGGTHGIGRAAAGIAVALVSVTLIGGCGSTARPGGSSAGSPSAPVADVVVTAMPAGAAVELASAETLQVIPPARASTTEVSTRYEVRPAGSPTLVAAGPPGRFVAARPGTATILVAQAPSCPFGQECPAHVVAVGSVRVTVTG